MGGETFSISCFKKCGEFKLTLISWIDWRVITLTHIFVWSLFSVMPMRAEICIINQWRAPRQTWYSGVWWTARWVAQEQLCRQTCLINLQRQMLLKGRTELTLAPSWSGTNMIACNGKNEAHTESCSGCGEEEVEDYEEKRVKTDGEWSISRSRLDHNDQWAPRSRL